MVMPKVVNSKLYILGVIGVLVSVLGTALLFTWPNLFKSILHSQMQITEGSHAYTMWRDTPIPMYMSFYFHNWTNPHELKTNKPRFVPMGPYRFNVVEKKTNIVFNSNGTVTFRISRKWFFDKEKSNGTLDDVVTTLNAVAVTAASTAKDWSSFFAGSLSMTLKGSGQRIFIQKKVGELLFFGYSDPLMEVAKKLPAFMGVDMPFDKFAWFYKRNDSSDFEGVLNMDTGANDIAQIGRLHRWNYYDETGFYDWPCSAVNGSAGELFPPNQVKERPLQFFTPDLCRSLKLPFDREVEILGVRGYRYAADQYSFDNGTHNPDNLCFCNGACSPSGVLNVTSCRYGAPGFISFPHYYMADQYYHDQVEGMRPEPDKHTLYITLEPETGIPLDVAARFQVNILLTPIERFSMFTNVPTIYFPMMWFEQRGGITKELAWQIKIALAMPLVGQIVAFLLTAAGVITVMYYTYLIVSYNNRSKESLVAKKEEHTLKPLIENKKIQFLPKQEEMIIAERTQ